MAFLTLTHYVLKVKIRLRLGLQSEGKAERFPHRGSAPSSTHQPERLVCSPARGGRGWELRLGLRSDRRERTGAGGVNTA